MSFTSSVQKIRRSLGGDSVRLALIANERRGDTPNHVKVTCRHVMFTADEKCQPLRNLLYPNQAFALVYGHCIQKRKPFGLAWCSLLISKL